MSAEPTPPPLPTPTFKLPGFVWLVWLPCAALVGWLSAHHGGGNDAFNIGYVLGSIVGTLVLPVCLSWVVWRLSGRKGSGATIVFLVLTGMVTFGQVNQSLEQGRRASAATAQLAQAVKKDQADMRASLERGEAVTPEQSRQVLQRTEARLQDMVDHSSGAEQRQSVAMQGFIRQLQGVQQHYADATQKLGLATFFELERVADAPARDERRAAVQEFQSAVNELRLAMDESASRLEAELKKQQVPAATTRDVLAGYNESARDRLQLLGKIRDKDDQLGAALQDFLGFAEKYDGQWKRDPKTQVYLLPTDAASAEFNAILDRVRKASTEQLALQKQVLGAR